MLNICKASAGSGKTHKLTGEYLKMLFGGEYYKYKSILAVTFTNKATAEMKDRILKELYKLSCRELKSGFLRDICALERFSKIDDEVLREEKVRQMAGTILSAILNDYSRFNISTIDKFFQKVLRAFAAESGHFYSYSVNIDDAGVLSVAVDELMNRLDEDEQLLDWLIRISLRFIEAGKNWNSVPSLLSLGAELFKEPFKMAALDVGEGFLSRDSIKDSETAVEGIVSGTVKKAQALGRSALDIMEKYGLEPEDFKGGSRSPLKFFCRLAEGTVDFPSASFYKLQEDVKEWTAAKNPKMSAVLSARADALADLVAQVCEDDSWIRDYLTAVEISRNLTVMGILSDLQREIRLYCRRNNIVVLSDTTKFLSDIIDGSDTPFIYEKVGVSTDNYLLDEFQDTSRMQWDNFMPLVKDSVDAGRTSLIVGDVKQSIYRWRGSDWRLLNSGITEDFPGSKMENLGFNWRSSAEVVGFNNEFFSFLASHTPDSPIVSEIYKDVAQMLPENRPAVPGHVRVEFFEGGKEIFQEQAYSEKIISSVRELLGRGYRPCDIALIVRTNNEGGMLSELLISNGFSIVTEDSLRISSSPEVKKVVDILRTADCSCVVEEVSIYNQCEGIIRDTLGEDCAATAAINAFLDCVNEFVASNGNSMRSFLSWWDSDGVKRNISAPEGEDSLRIITTHKSKGLEYPAVILPFFDGTFSMAANKGYLWCKSPSEKFGRLPYYPMEIRSALEDTHFAEEYRTELTYNTVDTINVAYVAFTRAERELIILPHFKRDSKGSVKPNSVAHLLYLFLEERMEDNVCEIGEWTSRPCVEVASPEKLDTEIFMDRVVSVPIGDRLKLSLRGEEFLSADSARRRGIVLHDILSGVQVSSDLDAAVSAAADSGMISLSERSAVGKMLEEMIGSVEAKHWFDGTYRLINETPIITPEGENYIPDRIMISGNTAIVVDYKFGHRHLNSYVHQVQNYMSLLQQMGYADVSGFLWYQDGIVEVNPR